MKKIDKNLMIQEIKKLSYECAFNIDTKILDYLEKAKNTEVSPIGFRTLTKIIENDVLAKEKSIPICQDTGISIIFLEIGNGIIFDFDLEESINFAIKEAYIEYYLRKSVVKHPLDRINTLTNTPCIIHTKFVNSNTFKITLTIKGAGSENMSKLKMLTPADGKNGVINFVLETIEASGGNACPPIIVGVGLGGNFEKAALLSKEALLRDIDDRSSNPIDYELENEIFEKANKLGIGPMGFGGKNTVLAVKVNSFPCHIASLPVAVNIQCHASRTKSVIL
ncbi:MAG: fumarate hydratase [Bacilli bacterium]|nr:fumarate hydratase [Bacilli bacterium]